VSIGDTLAAGRRQAGLTITQVAQRTCIRETIIRGIERGDFSGCGGDFYARGHIRSIAGAVGVDPQPLVEEYDATMGAPRAISAADVFQPVTPVKLKERRKPNWTAAMAVALVVIAGIFAYQHFSARPSVAQPAGSSRPTVTSHKTKKKTPVVVRHPVYHRLEIKLTATQDCWVQLTSASGYTVFSGMVYAGKTMTWTARRPVTMIVGNPSAVTLTVNGRHPLPRGAVTTVTLYCRISPAWPGYHGQVCKP